MLSKGSLETYGISFHPGDIIENNDPAFLVVDVDARDGQFTVFDFITGDEIRMDGKDLLKTWHSIKTAGGNVWRCIGHDSLLRTEHGVETQYLLQAHHVYMHDPPEGHPEQSYCLSWDKRSQEVLSYPTNMEYAKFRDSNRLFEALESPGESEMLDGLSPWTYDDGLSGFIEEFTTSSKDLHEERQQELEWFTENEDQIRTDLIRDGIISYSVSEDNF